MKGRSDGGGGKGGGKGTEESGEEIGRRAAADRKETAGDGGRRRRGRSCVRRATGPNSRAPIGAGSPSDVRRAASLVNSPAPDEARAGRRAGATRRPPPRTSVRCARDDAGRRPRGRRVPGGARARGPRVRPTRRRRFRHLAPRAYGPGVPRRRRGTHTHPNYFPFNILCPRRGPRGVRPFAALGRAARTGARPRGSTRSASARRPVSLRSGRVAAPVPPHP